MTLSREDIRPLAYMQGSLPFGGQQDATPIYGYFGPEVFSKETAPLNHAERKDLQAGGKLAFVIRNVASKVECRALQTLTERIGYSEAAPGIVTPAGMRQNKTVHWLAQPGTLDALYARIVKHLPQNIDGIRLSNSFSERINMYRYDSGDVFNPHIDGDWPGFGMNSTGDQMVEWPGQRSKLTMLLYVNSQMDGIIGGETEIYDRGEVVARVKPETGTALFFRHGRTPDSVLHAGAVLGDGPSKYVARINVLYG